MLGINIMYPSNTLQPNLLTHERLASLLQSKHTLSLASAASQQLLDPLQSMSSPLGLTVVSLYFGISSLHLFRQCLVSLLCLTYWIWNLFLTILSICFVRPMSRYLFEYLFKISLKFLKKQPISYITEENKMHNLLKRVVEILKEFKSQGVSKEESLDLLEFDSDEYPDMETLYKAREIVYG
jgi:hypothetical protein